MFREVQSKSNYNVVAVQFKSKLKPLNDVALNQGFAMLKSDNVFKRRRSLYSYIYFMARVQNASKSSHFHVFGKNP